MFAIFQAYINYALANLINIFCIIYFNNIFIYSNSKKEYWEHIKQILFYFCKFKFFINFNKYAFNIKEFEFLKYIISTNNIKINPGRVIFILK